VLAVAGQRLHELRRSARNEARLLARGGREHAPRQIRCMRILHALWLGGMLTERSLWRPPTKPSATAISLAVFLMGQGLRFAAMRELGERWSVKVITLPGATAVSSGIFRWLRHPNYVGVILEMAALPLAGGAYATAAMGSVANALLLRARIKTEEAALREDGAPIATPPLLGKLRGEPKEQSELHEQVSPGVLA